MDPNKVVKDILDYVDWQFKKANPQNLKGPYNFVFGNIAFSHDGEDKINIGEKMVFGEKGMAWPELLEKNREFGEGLNLQECFSITKYLKHNRIKIFSLSFKGQKKELELIPFVGDSIDAINYSIESDIQDGDFKYYRPSYFNEYPAPKGFDDTYAIDTFKKTLEYYNEFHDIVKKKYPQIQDGHIYLIRPKLDLGGGFAALAYMYLWYELDAKDMEIISQKLSMYFLDLLKQKAELEAVKSAKAAIMSRNMSHNLGSHVMFYIKQKLESVEKILQTGALKDLVKSSSLKEIEARVKSEVSLGKEMPFLVGLGRFLNYLQERQDYIATVATSYIPYNTTINFKDAIYDELKPEKHSLRHKGDAVGRKAANLLLDYIAKSEGFDSSDNIELWFGNDFNGGEDEKAIVPDNLRTLNVSLPGGNLGRQAFFSIMENIIRNTAKHDGSKSKAGKLKFQFDILLPENVKEIRGFSKRNEESSNLNTCYTDFKNRNDFVYLGITVKLHEDGDQSVDITNDIENTIKHIKEGLKRPYVNEENGEMDEECKGLKEIRLSAAWIRGESLDCNIPKDEPPAVAIRKNGNNLQYVICLPRPKKVAIVSSSYVDKEVYHVKDCKVCKPDDIAGLSKYELIVYHGEEDEFYNKSIRPFVGARVFADKLSDIKNDEKLFDDITVFYRKWLEHAFYKEKEYNRDAKVSIIDFKAPAVIQTEDRIKPILMTSSRSSETDDRYYKNNIVFNTHYKGQNLEDNATLYAKARFVEAISGGDSTDRLIRRDVRDFEWYCKHLSAGLTQVAIMDERLFSMIMPPVGIDLCDVERIVDDFLAENSPGANLAAFLSYPKFDVFNLTEEKLLQIHKNSRDNNMLVRGLLIKNFSFITRDYSKTWKYREKGIWAFNIQIENHEILIKGYNAIPTRGEIGLYDSYYKECIIGRIRKDSGIIRVVFEPNCEGFKNKFDFISMHQGLMDKIYGELGIKKNKDEKEKVAKAVFDAFSSKVGSAVEIIEGKSYFLPQFIIHSGRSKPNKEDMPQHLPFLQFSAVDHAIRDCKYTLTELLYSAHYE